MVTVLPLRIFTWLWFTILFLSTVESLNLSRREDSSPPELQNTTPTNPLKLQMVYSLGFHDPEKGEFGGSLTFYSSEDLTKAEDWSLTFSFPNSLTQVLRFVGPMKFSHYNDVHLLSLKGNPSQLTNPFTVTFVAISPTHPTTWQDIQATNFVLHLGPKGSAVAHKLTLDSDYFLPTLDSSLPISPSGIYDLPALNSNEKVIRDQFAALSKPELQDSTISSQEQKADGTYLVGTQYSLIVTSIVLSFGFISYIAGSVLRLRHRKRFRVEKLKRARTVTGYSRLT